MFIIIVAIKTTPYQGSNLTLSTKPLRELTRTLMFRKKEKRMQWIRLAFTDCLFLLPPSGWNILSLVNWKIHGFSLFRWVNPRNGLHSLLRDCCDSGEFCCHPCQDSYHSGRSLHACYRPFWSELAWKSRRFARHRSQGAPPRQRLRAWADFGRALRLFRFRVDLLDHRFALSFSPSMRLHQFDCGNHQYVISVFFPWKICLFLFF